MEEELDLKLDELELFLATASYVRYALGRKSYIVDSCCRFLMKVLPKLHPNSQHNILNEIEKELAAARHEGKYVGMKMDHEEWVNVVSILKGGLIPNVTTKE